MTWDNKEKASATDLPEDSRTADERSHAESSADARCQGVEQQARRAADVAEATGRRVRLMKMRTIGLDVFF
jgi:hypothetical protein